MALNEAEVETLEFIFESMKGSGGGVLSDWERSFMNDQQTRYEQYGAETRFSDKQWAIIQKVEIALTTGERSRR